MPGGFGPLRLVFLATVINRPVEINPDAERGNEDDFWPGQSRQIKCMGQHRAKKYDGLNYSESARLRREGPAC
jgi:hypothetical protein